MIYENKLHMPVMPKIDLYLLKFCSLTLDLISLPKVVCMIEEIRVPRKEKKNLLHHKIAKKKQRKHK